MSESQIPTFPGINPSNGNTIFHEAVKHGFLSLLYYIRDNTEGPYSSILAKKNNDGEACIHIAVKKHVKQRAISFVKVLLELGADINAKHEASGCTALHISVQRGDHELAEWLSRQPGIDLYAADSNDMMPFDIALINSDHRTLDILLEVKRAEDAIAEVSDSELSDRSK